MDESDPPLRLSRLLPIPPLPALGPNPAQDVQRTVPSLARVGLLGACEFLSIVHLLGHGLGRGLVFLLSRGWETASFGGPG